MVQAVERADGDICQTGLFVRAFDSTSHASVIVRDRVPSDGSELCRRIR